MFHIVFFPILMENLLGVTIVVVSYLDSVIKVLNVTVSKNPIILHSGLRVTQKSFHKGILKYFVCNHLYLNRSMNTKKVESLVHTYFNFILNILLHLQ